MGFYRTDGRRAWMLSNCRLLNPDMPGQSDMLISFLDVTAERETADKAMFYASHDTLTDLPNRASVLRKLNRALQSTNRRPVAQRCCSSTSTTMDVSWAGTRSRRV